ncbi:class I SAM-dependent methyltransferase [Halogranum rubrum]|nr:class I SAM-dependent methyltransferase [Halogranum salarium]
MRRFSAEYLRRTREGMWADSRAALANLDLDSRSRILDVGCGTGELSRVLADESDADVVCVDADRDLLRVAREETGLPIVAGDATGLPFADDTFDLVICQALLVNLPDPTAAVEEFARVSSDLVAAVEPDNADVSVDSTVSEEVTLERRVREAYLAGVETDVALGEAVGETFRDCGLADVRSRRYDHEKVVDAPYDEADLQDAARKASGAGLADHETELRRALSTETYDELRRAWRAMGRDVIAQIQEAEYRRVEVVPFDVTVGRVSSTSVE